MAATTGTGMGTDRIVVHAARETDLGAALALIDTHGPRRRTARIREFVTGAIEVDSRECQALIADVDGQSAAVAVYGEVAGTVGTASLDGVIVSADFSPVLAGEVLVAQVIERCRTAGVRLVVAEVPGDEEDFMALLRTAGFAEESRIDDYYEDGIPLVQYRLDLR